MTTKLTLYIILLLAAPALLASPAGENFTVVIDAGHGGKDPGARGAKSVEKTINLQVALRLGRMIREEYPGVKVLYTREDDRFVPLDTRADIANRNKADLFISIHVNSVRKGGSARGAETYALGLAKTDENLEVAMRENSAILLEDNYQQRYEGFDPNSTESYIIFEFMQNKHLEQSISFASEVQKGFAQAGRADRGVRQAGFLVLRKTGMPGVLVELGFISNPAEEQYMSSAAGQDALAGAIAKAFGSYKRSFDKRQPAGAPSPPLEETVAPPPPQPESPAGRKPEGSVYRIQILTSDKKLPAGSRFFKGYKDVEVFHEKGIYKYTYGKSSDYNAILKLWRKVRQDFKDAFIVTYKDGKRVY